MKNKFVEAISNPEIIFEPLNSSNYKKSLKRLISDLRKSEKYPIEKIKFIQHKKLKNLLKFAFENSQFYRSRVADSNINFDSDDFFAELKKVPILKRSDIQENHRNLECGFKYPTHSPFAYTQTSGSSGEPVKILRSGVNQRFWQAFTMREHEWYKRDYTKNFAAIRANLSSDKPISAPNWGAPASIVVDKMGQGFAIKINTPITQQLEWLERVKPAYLIIYPSNLSALIDSIENKKGELDSLLEVRTIGETVSDHLRQRVRDILNCRIVDNYSSQELGTIALQCPDSSEVNYHIMSESYVVEILDDKGNEVKEGESGRLVITDLVNYSMPIIRYEIRDYAVKGKKCSCGRNMPSISKILGRERNMAVHKGNKFWPLVGFAEFRSVAPIKKYQVIQESEEQITLKYYAAKKLGQSQQEQISKIIQSALGFDADISFEYFAEDFAKSDSGKFEEFICRV